jgi:hypothetical protein
VCNRLFKKSKEDEMDKAYSRHVRDDKWICSFSCKTCREETTWVDLRVYGRIALKYVF